MTPDECEREYGHIWRYRGDVGIAIRKCSYCSKTEEILGIWKTVTQKGISDE